ncbi:5-oxoprolinase subunit PxpB [Endozoicomonas sp. 4G]|uniref:5-oxoprolinase subunit PxpB n=1 Tax=Endozoicomonas sp. 4G TaxID=2872754 RepID=UPI002078E5C3|nr:5-oxoprolinase subunit PxpB [Endozoicomonas sp. 4G]
MNICRVNENSVIVYFSDTISPDTADAIARVIPVIRQELGSCLVDMIPSYTSILISFDPVVIGLKAFVEELKQALVVAEHSGPNLTTADVIKLPVYYGPEVSLDAEEVSAHTGLSFDQIVDIHSSTLYRVYAIGFVPGFAYLGNTDQRIAIPRKKTPRLKVPQGSLAIAEQQTAIYPRPSPGGWQIIGRTPVGLIDYQSENLTVFKMGTKVKFTPVSKEKYLELGGVFSVQDHPGMEAV